MLTPDQEQLLRLYRKCATMREACRIAGHDKAIHYEWLNESEEYRQVFRSVNREKLDDHMSGGA